MAKDYVGNELKVSDVVLDLNERVVCRIVKIWNKSVTTDVQLERENEHLKRYGHRQVDETTCRNHKLAKCFVRILLPEEQA